MDFDLLKTVVHSDASENEEWSKAHSAVERVIELLRACDEIMTDVPVRDVYDLIALQYVAFVNGEEK